MIEILAVLRSPVLVLATIACGLQAGTYYAWASGVMPGLARVDDRTFVQTMQQVNLAIVNPVFLLTFVGAPALALLAIAGAGGSARPWVVAGAVLAVATVLITAVGNIPLNDALEATGERGAFERRWVRLNIGRSITSAGSLTCLVVALLRA